MACHTQAVASLGGDTRRTSRKGEVRLGSRRVSRSLKAQGSRARAARGGGPWPFCPITWEGRALTPGGPRRLRRRSCPLAGTELWGSQGQTRGQRRLEEGTAWTSRPPSSRSKPEGLAQGTRVCSRHTGSGRAAARQRAQGHGPRAGPEAGCACHQRGRLAGRTLTPPAAGGSSHASLRPTVPRAEGTPRPDLRALPGRRWGGRGRACGQASGSSGTRGRHSRHAAGAGPRGLQPGP